MNDRQTGHGTSPPPRWCSARVTSNDGVSRTMRLVELALELPEAAEFMPGQFAMLHLHGHDRLTFGRPFSILSGGGGRVSILYRVAGEATARLAALGPGDSVVYLGPLGRPFPAPEAGRQVLLLAGGVGLPPLLAWHERYGRREDQAFFGAQEEADVPWRLLSSSWQVSVDRIGGASPGRSTNTISVGWTAEAAAVDRRRALYHGTVVGCCEAALTGELADRAPGEPPLKSVFACGPLPMLRAAAEFAAARAWPCLVSVEEHMGCGYGVCRGCVVPARDGSHLTACQDGPVLPAGDLDWNRFGTAGATVATTSHAHRPAGDPSPPAVFEGGGCR